MGSRYKEGDEKRKINNVNLNIFSERLKKIRALNCSPSDVGIDGYILKGLHFNKLSVLTKFL